MANVGYSEKWVKSVTLEEFLKAQDHNKTLTYLKGDYERITGKKAEQGKAVKAETETK